MNFLIGLGLFVQSLFQLAVPAIFGIVASGVGVVGLFNAYRIEVKNWVTYAFFLTALYLGVHIVIAFLDPQMFSYFTGIWTLGFLGTSALALWTLGDWPLDLTLIISSLPEDQFKDLLNALQRHEEEAHVDVEHEVSGPPSLIHPVRRVLYYFHRTMNYPRGTAVFILGLWRRMGKALLGFLKYAYWVGLLFGLYFWWIPPSNNWRMFGGIMMSFAAFAISGPGFNEERWRRVSIVSLLLSVVISVLTPFHPQRLAMPNLPSLNYFTLSLGILAVYFLSGHVGKFFHWINPPLPSDSSRTTTTTHTGGQ